MKVLRSNGYPRRIQSAWCMSVTKRSSEVMKTDLSKQTKLNSWLENVRRKSDLLEEVGQYHEFCSCQR
jgi:hypothetical protein